MKDSIRRLPDAELEVMQAVWACKSPITRTDVEKILFQTHPMAMTTLLPLLKRLSDKGFLTIEKVGRKSHYTPCISRETYLASQSKTFVDKLCGGSISAFATALCSSGLTKEELAQLRDMLVEGTL